MTKLDYERLAAYIDGEGWISIVKIRPKKYRSNVYQLRFGVSNCDKRLTDWCKNTFGGSVYMIEAENLKDSYRWDVGPRLAYDLSKKLKPFLLLKREQADLAINFYEECLLHRKGGPIVTSLEEEKRYAFQQKMKELNKRGPSNKIYPIAATTPLSINRYAKLAAFVDGEGNIAISLTGIKQRKFAIRLIITNTDKRLIEWCLINFGGHSHVGMKETEKRKTTYKWVLGTYDTYNTLTKIKEYLIIKSLQADLVIECYNQCFKESYMGKEVPIWLKQKREYYSEKMKQLNGYSNFGGNHNPRLV